MALKGLIGHPTPAAQHKPKSTALGRDVWPSPESLHEGR